MKNVCTETLKTMKHFWEFILFSDKLRHQKLMQNHDLMEILDICFKYILTLT